MNKTFRGQLAHETQDTIRLSTNNGLTGYKIVKFEIMQTDPSEQPENAVKVYTHEQATIDANVNFNDPKLLAAGMLWSSTNQIYPHDKQIIFDNKIINQDIFITNFDEQFNAAALNYYLELEQIKLDHDEAAVATLKDMRGRE